MSWSLNMGGHVGPEREREILAAAQEFCKKVGQDGSGTFSGHYTGLTQLPPPHATAERGS